MGVLYAKGNGNDYELVFCQIELHPTWAKERSTFLDDSYPTPTHHLFTCHHDEDHEVGRNSMKNKTTKYRVSQKQFPDRIQEIITCVLEEKNNDLVASSAGCMHHHRWLQPNNFFLLEHAWIMKKKWFEPAKTLTSQASSWILSGTFLGTRCTTGASSFSPSLVYLPITRWYWGRWWWGLLVIITVVKNLNCEKISF